jgi:WD40 repeat protein
MPQPPGSIPPGSKLPGSPLPSKLAGAAPRAGEPVADVLGAEVNLGAPVTAVLATGEGFCFTTGDGRVHIGAGAIDPSKGVAAHAGAILSAAAHDGGVLTGGDDGRLVHVTAGGAVEIWRSTQRRWVDCVSARADSAIAWASGKVVYLKIDGETRELAIPSAAGGLAFAPTSNRLAIGHYGGATVWNLAAAEDTTQLFAWKGSHLETLWSPDEKYLVTAMQEGAVHGWRLADASDFAMRGYPGKPRSLSFTRKGDWMATSGAFEAVAWPFVGKGPMGKTPEQIARRTYQVTAVAFHPLNPYLATGYQDGVVLLARIEDRKELMVRRSIADGAAVSGLAWAPDGKRLAYGTEDGRAGVVDFSSVGGGRT